LRANSNSGHSFASRRLEACRLAAAHRDDFGGLHRRHDPVVLCTARREVRSATGVTVFAA